MRNLLCAVGVLLVSGCLAGAPVSNPDGAETEAREGLTAFFARSGPSGGPRKPPLARVSLAGGDVVVAGPDGYCVDPSTRRTAPERGFALIASCHILSGGKAGRPVVPMLVTVTVGPRGDSADLPTPKALAQAANAKLLTGKTSSDRVAAHLASGGDAMFDGSDPRYWRAAFLQGDRLVGLALYAPRGSALAGDQGAAMITRVKDRIAQLSASSPQRRVTPAQKPTGGLLGRLFNRQDLPQ
ncbi:dihydroxy-acid dehydratase [Antarctobacter sp.]|uniref:dihydroxy-acid dehydratase n=1 Tax=Antarctobacter sp. TaxID=1872577 RepID=UPI002B265B81|nr:dihydroxy-acid dehydratase [Antarctobacter sp.]